ncbi:MAG: hypothetical protein IJS29_07820 [Selenomonadaceae bacterium]|nr:hypothetical protein [Selenomonadaceae bacterium]
MYNSNSNTLFSGSLGNDEMTNFGINNVTIDGAGGTDTFWNNGARATFIGKEGDDYFYNSGKSATIFAGDGNDLIDNYGSSALIYCEGGNDTIDNTSIGDHSTIVGGAGDDLLNIYDYKDNNVILYAEGDGNDVVINTGIQGHFDATLSITKGSYTQAIDGNDLLVKVGDGSIRFKDMANTKVNIEGTAGTSTPSTESTTTTTTAQTTTATVQTTTSTVQTTTQTTSTPTTTTAIAQTTTPTTTQTTSTPTVINNYYGDTYNVNDNNGTVVIGSSVEGGVTNTTTVDNSTNIVISGNTWTYNGGNKYIDNYQQGEVVRLDSDYKGFDLKGSSFLVNSSSGQLEIQNSRDKFIGYSANNSEVVAYSYVSSKSGNVDGRGKSQAEIMIGGDNANNQIFAGSGGSSMWGGNGGTDTLTGGEGYDEFFYAIGSGNDVIKSAGDNDVVNLLGVSLSQITYAEANYHGINIGFTDGGHLQLQGQSATGFKLEGVTYTANRSTGEWTTKS